MDGKTTCGAALLGCLALIAVGSLAPRAQAAVPGDLVWALSARGGGNEIANDIAVDAAGNAIVTGVFTDSITFGAGEPNETTLSDPDGRVIYDQVFIAKYAPDGTLHWARSVTGSQNRLGRGVAVDPTGNALVTGTFLGSATFGVGEPNETTLTGRYAMFIAQYAPDGSLRWARSAGVTSVVEGLSIAADAAGNALVTGHFNGSTTFGAGEANETTLTVPSFSGPDIFVAKYDPNGSLIWARSAGGSSSDGGRGVAVDAGGNALVTGYYLGSATFGAGEANETTLAGDGIFIAQYAPDGTLRWARSAANGHVSGNGIAVDTAGNALVMGFIQGSVTFGAGEPNETTLSSESVFFTDVFIAQYAADGALRWARSAGGSSGDSAAGVAVDAAGNALVTGNFGGDATFGAGEPSETTLTGVGDTDVFVAQYAPEGTLLWARSAASGDFVEVRAIALDASGNASLVGGFEGTATFGAGEENETTLDAAQYLDIFIAKYAGAPVSEQPDLAITKHAWPNPARVGRDLTYKLIVANWGTGDATKVVVRDWLPATVRVVSMPKRCRLIEGGKVRCWLGNLAGGAEKQLKIVVRPKHPGLLINRAKVTAAEADLNPADNKAILKTRVLGCCGHGYGGCR